MSNSPTPAVASLAAPTVARRLISMVYETLLGLAVLFLPFLVFEIATQASHAKVVEHMRQALAFLVLGAYFIHQWSREGQTLAMRTWRIKLVMPGREHVPLQAAAVRYLLAWLWIVPAALLDYAFGLAHWQALGVLGAGILAWSGTALFDKDGQFLHDRLTGTRLVQLPKPEKKKKTA